MSFTFLSMCVISDWDRWFRFWSSTSYVISFNQPCILILSLPHPLPDLRTVESITSQSLRFSTCSSACYAYCLHPNTTNPHHLLCTLHPSGFSSEHKIKNESSPVTTLSSGFLCCAAMWQFSSSSINTWIKKTQQEGLLSSFLWSFHLSFPAEKIDNSLFIHS